MHEYLKQSREGAAKKLKGIQSGEPHTKVDSSSWSPPEMLEADKQNGMRPVSKRQYKSGGKVHGEHAKKRADRKARKEGGRTMSIDGFINRDDKMANDERAGVKKVGGMKRGGRTHKNEGGDIDPSLMDWKILRQKLKDSVKEKTAASKGKASANPLMGGKQINDDQNESFSSSGLKRGGRAHKGDGGIADLIRQDEIEQGMKGRGLPMRVPMPTPRPADKPVKYTGPKPTTNPNTGYKKGGAAHTDEAQDKKLMHKILKPKAFKGEGGSMGRRRYDKLDELDQMFGPLRRYQQATQQAAQIRNTLRNQAMNGVFGPEEQIQERNRSENASLTSSGLKRGGKAKPKKASGGQTEAQRVGRSASMYDKAIDTQDVDMMEAANKYYTKTRKQSGDYKSGGRTKHASGGEAGRGLYVRQGYPHEVPGADGGRTAKKGGGSLGKGKTNVNIMIHPHSGAGNMPPAMPPMSGLPIPPRPPVAPPMPPQGMPMGAPPMGGAPAMPPMGAGRPGMPPIGRKSGGKVEHVIDHAAGGGLGRLEKIKAYGLE
jgi:hypothetical protein